MAIVFLSFLSGIGRLTQLPSALLIYAAIILIPCSIFMFAVALKASEYKPLVWIIVLGNLAWLLASLFLLVSDLVAPTMLGSTFIVIQALAVAGLTGAEIYGLRQQSRLAYAS